MPKRMLMRKRNRNASTSESSDAHLFPSVLDRPSVNPHVTPDSSSDEMRPTRKIRKPQCVKVTKTVFINLDPTTVSSYHINKYFPNVEFSCPSDTVIHEELQGETSADILKDLLQDMEGKQFPLITFADFTAAISQSVPKDVDENIEQNVVAPMLELLNMICYKSDTTSEMTESYQALHLAVGKLIFEQSKAWTNPFLFDLEKFLGSILDRSRPHNNDNEAHYHMVQFWKQILLCFVCVDKELSMKFDLSDATWCDSYHACRSKGQRLLTIKDEMIEEALTNELDNLELSGSVWLGSRRKDYGQDWTWINDSLSDFVPEVRGPEDRISGNRPYAALFVIPGKKTIDIGPGDGRYYICSNGNASEDSIDISWYSAQAECTSSNGRLATADEYEHLDLEPHTYWVGLYYRPWIWIGENVDEPVIYFKSDLTETKDDERSCLSLRLSDMSWVPRDCSLKLNTTLICESIEGSTAMDGDNGEQPIQQGYIGLGLCCALTCVIVIVIGLKKTGYIKGITVTVPKPGAVARDIQAAAQVQAESVPDPTYSHVVCGPGPPTSSTTRRPPPSGVYSQVDEPAHSNSRVSRKSSLPPITVTSAIYSVVNKMTRTIQRSRPGANQAQCGDEYSLGGVVADSGTDEDIDEAVVMVENSNYENSGIWGENNEDSPAVIRAPKLKPKVGKKPRDFTNRAMGSKSATLAVFQVRPAEAELDRVRCPQGDVYTVVEKKTPKRSK